MPGATRPRQAGPVSYHRIPHRQTTYEMLNARITALRDELGTDLRDEIRTEVQLIIVQVRAEFANNQTAVWASMEDLQSSVEGLRKENDEMRKEMEELRREMQELVKLTTSRMLERNFVITVLLIVACQLWWMM